MNFVRGIPGRRSAGTWVNRIAFGLCLSLGLLFPSQALIAHHGLARFDTTHIVEMPGTITNFQWINPHAYVYADLVDAHGKTANWMLECGSLGMLSRFGWSPDVIKRGDKVKVRGFVAKDGTAYMSLQRIELSNGKALSGAP